MTLEEILAEVQPEGSPVELEGENKDEGGKETPSESPAEEKPTDATPSQEGVSAEEEAPKAETKANIPDENNALPFNKHPRWQEKLDEIASLRSERDAFQSKIDDLEKRFNELTSQKQYQPTETVPTWFSNVWGDDPNVWAEAKKSIAPSGLSEDQISDLMGKFLEKRELEKQQTAEKEKAWIKQSFNSIEEKFGVKLPEGSDERNEFVNWALKVRPTTDDGTSLDLVRGYEAWQEVKELRKAKNAQATQSKKTVAALTSDTRSVSPTPKPSSDPEKIRNLSFRELALQAAMDEGIIQ